MPDYYAEKDSATIRSARAGEPVEKVPLATGTKLVTISFNLSAGEASQLQKKGDVRALLRRAALVPARIDVRPADPTESVKDARCPRCGDAHLCWESCVRCACGGALVDRISPEEVTPDGWLHTRWKCTPPPDPERRCHCGFAVLRSDVKGARFHDRWSTASYSSSDPDAKYRQREHYREHCIPHVDF